MQYFCSGNRGDAVSTLECWWIFVMNTMFWNSIMYLFRNVLEMCIYREMLWKCIFVEEWSCWGIVLARRENSIGQTGSRARWAQPRISVQCVTLHFQHRATTKHERRVVSNGMTRSVAGIQKALVYRISTHIFTNILINYSLNK